MQSMRLLAAVTGTLVLGSACGDGGGGTPPPENEAPVANFTVPVGGCTVNAVCTFLDTSTDDVAVTTWRWDFTGDGTPDATTQDAAHSYAAAGTFTVVLTVTDGEGLTNTKTATVVVAPVAPPANVPPTAGFTSSCTDTNCAFTNSSTDTDGTITYLWNFGEPASGANNESTLEDPTHGYTVTAPTTFTVTLTVTDDDGATDVETQTLSVSPPPNASPTAGFTHSCNATDCTFTNSSTDTDGTITYLWNFGEPASGASNQSTLEDPTHVYTVTAPTTFTVTLTVTDDDGATDVETQTLSVSPPIPGVEGCITSGTRVDCVLDITARSTVKLKLIGISCDLPNQRVTVPPPIGDQVFLNVCLRTAGEELGIFGGPTDSLIVFEAGSQVRIRINQGTADAGILGPPAARLVGTFPSWTIDFEDGANPGGAGEPDFADVVLGVQATVVP